MFEFFRGWKRKIGVLTLVMACLFAAGWVRSFHTIERFYPNATREPVNDFYSLKSDRARLIFQWWYSSEKFGARHGEHYDSFTFDATDPPKEDHGACLLCAFGFEIRSGQMGGTIRQVSCAIPYWSIVIPLTLLSAWLLLSKSRAKNLPTESPPKTEP